MVITQNTITASTNNQYGLNTVAQTENVEKQNLTTKETNNKDTDSTVLSVSLSSSMRKQSKMNTTELNSAQEKISLYQSADMSLAEMNRKLYRITQLSIQASSGNSTGDVRKEIQDEINKLKLELQDIGENAQFNKQPMFNTGSEAPGMESVASPYETGKINLGKVLEDIETIDVTAVNGTESAVKQSLQAMNYIHDAREEMASKEKKLAELIHVDNEGEALEDSRAEDRERASELLNRLNERILEYSTESLQVQANQQNAEVLALLQ